MKKTYVALLRGINVGGNSKVSMAELKQCFADLGYEDVKTYINSGNVIFKNSSGPVELMVKNIEKVIAKHFGFEIKVVIRDAENIKAVCKSIPAKWVNNSEMKTDVMFLWEEFDSKKVLDEIKINPEVDNVEYVKGALIWNIDRKDYGRSGMGKLIGTQVYKNMTVRNVNTARKLLDLMSE